MSRFPRIGVAAAILPLGIAAVPFASGTALARSETFRATIHQLNRSGVSGTLTIRLDTRTNRASIHLLERGVLANMPHAQHLHFGASARHRCPKPSAAGRPYKYQKQADIIASVQAMPDYGPVNISLTTRGDTSKKSGLALDRFPTPLGATIRYQRTIKLSASQVRHLERSQYVIATHGLDYTGDGIYSPQTAPSALAIKMFGPVIGGITPLEATAPNACARVKATAANGSRPSRTPRFTG